MIKDKRLIIIIFVSMLTFFTFTYATEPRIDFTTFVKPLIGTGGHGHTFPGAAVPFGMVQLSPDTDTEGWDWYPGYHYSDNSIMDFSHTHLSGTGVSDLGDILVMPIVGAIKTNPGSKEKLEKEVNDNEKNDIAFNVTDFFCILFK